MPIPLHDPFPPPAHISPKSARDRLIVALDLGSSEENLGLVEKLGDSVSFYKVGWISLVRGGMSLIEHLLRQQKQIFLDLKLFDVPNTVQESVKAVASFGVEVVTVHGQPDLLHAAVDVRAATAA